MKKVAAIVASILVPVVAVFLFPASDVQGGAAGTPLGKTSGPTVTATIVIDLTGTTDAAPKGLASMRIQRSGGSAAAFFTMSPVPVLANCTAILNDMQSWFEGWDLWWVPGTVKTALFGSADAGNKAGIVDADYATCNNINGRDYLSFTAVIQFAK